MSGVNSNAVATHMVELWQIHIVFLVEFQYNQDRMYVLIIIEEEME